jgi:hypothetical protein
MGSGVNPSHSSYTYYSESTVSDEHVVVDGAIITAQGQAYVEFAVELARQMGLCENEKTSYILSSPKMGAMSE